MRTAHPACPGLPQAGDKCEGPVKIGFVRRPPPAARRTQVPSSYCLTSLRFWLRSLTFQHFSLNTTRKFGLRRCISAVGVVPHTNPKRKRGRRRRAASDLRHPSLTLRVSVARPFRSGGDQRGLSTFQPSWVRPPGVSDFDLAGRAGSDGCRRSHCVQIAKELTRHSQYPTR